MTWFRLILPLGFCSGIAVSHRNRAGDCFAEEERGQQPQGRERKAALPHLSDVAHLSDALRRGASWRGSHDAHGGRICFAATSGLGF